MPTIDGTVFPAARGGIQYDRQIDQDIFVSAAGTVHAWDQRQQVLAQIKFSMRLSQSDMQTLTDKWLNVARGALNPVNLRLDGEVSDRTVHFWLGNRGLRQQKLRNDLFLVSVTFLQVGGTDAVPA